MPAENVTEFGGWPQPPRWVWVAAGFTAAAVLAGVLAARAGPRHAAASSPAGATAPVRVQGIPAKGPVAFWPPAPGACGPAVVVLPPIRGAQGVADVAFSPKGKLLASSDADGTVRLWNPASSDANGAVRLWNAATGQPARAAAPPPGQMWGWRTAPPGGGCWPIVGGQTGGH